MSLKINPQFVLVNKNLCLGNRSQMPDIFNIYLVSLKKPYL